MQINLNKLKCKTNIYFRNEKLKHVEDEIKKLQINSKTKNACIIEFYTVIHQFKIELGKVQNCDTFAFSQSVGA
jgi:hypothetical protein